MGLWCRNAPSPARPAQPQGGARTPGGCAADVSSSTPKNQNKNTPKVKGRGALGDLMHRDGEAALVAYGERSLLLCAQNPHMRYRELGLYALRYVSRACARAIRHPLHLERGSAHARCADFRSVRACAACGRVRRQAIRFKCCRRCRPDYAPELSRRTIREVLGVPRDCLGTLAWRFSSEVPLRRVSPALRVWLHMQQLAAAGRGGGRLRKWLALGEPGFIAAITQRGLRV